MIRDVEPMYHPGSQAPRRTIVSPTDSQQIVSLRSFDIHIVPPNQPRIHDYPDIKRRTVPPPPKKKCVAQKQGNFRLLVNTTSPILSGFTDNPTSSHRVSTVFGNFPTARKQMPSARRSLQTHPLPLIL
jgi:hypothetical protein